MSTFDLKNLKAANSFEGLGKPEQGGALTAKAAAVRNIDAQLALIDPKAGGTRTFWDTVVDGKRSYSGKGTSVGFSIKIGASKLLIAGTQEVGVAKADFEAALKALKAAIEAGNVPELEAQFKELDKARSSRTQKMKETRAAKKEAPVK